ncbi:MAG TPA: DMT family transporter [Rhizobiaceae bacterium]|nr:DMT family transporter [Rhizobiaceae bacterium]
MTVSNRLVPPAFVFLWATGFIGARYAMPWAEPFSFLAVRFIVACAILAIIALILGSRRATRHEAINSAIAGALIHGLYLGGIFWAIRNGMPAGISGLIVGLQPLLTAMMAGQFLQEKILPRHWIGLVIGLVGVIVVLSPKFGTTGAGITVPTVTAAVLGVVAISAGTIWQKKFATSADLITGTAWQYLGASIVTVLAALALETGRYTLTAELALAMLWAVFVLSIGAILLLMIMIRQGEMSKVASLLYLVPAVTAIIAWILFGEQLTLVQIAGMVLVTIGVWLAAAQPRTRALASK